MDYGRNVQSVMAMTIYLNWYHDKSMYLLDSEKAFCRRCCGHGGWNWPLPFLLNSQIFRTPLLHDKWWQCSDSALWWWLVSSFYLLVRSSNDSFLLFLSWYLSSSSWMNLFNFFKIMNIFISCSLKFQFKLDLEHWSFHQIVCWEK